MGKSTLAIVFQGSYLIPIEHLHDGSVVVEISLIRVSTSFDETADEVFIP